MRKTNRFFCLAYVIVLFLYPITTEATEKRMTVYDYILKDGKILYCSGFGGIYRADLRRKKLKWIVKKSGNVYDKTISSMMKKDSYLYYIENNMLYRVHVPSGAIKRLAGSKDLYVDEYVISGSKIYCYQEDQKYDRNNRNYRSGTFVMKLNGEEKRKSEDETWMNNRDTNIGKKYTLSWRVKKIKKNKWRADEYVKKSGKKLFHIKRYFYWRPPKGTVFL